MRTLRTSSATKVGRGDLLRRDRAAALSGHAASRDFVGGGLVGEAEAWLASIRQPQLLAGMLPAKAGPTVALHCAVDRRRFECRPLKV